MRVYFQVLLNGNSQSCPKRCPLPSLNPLAPFLLSPLRTRSSPLPEPQPLAGAAKAIIPCSQQLSPTAKPLGFTNQSYTALGRKLFIFDRVYWAGQKGKKSTSPRKDTQD